MDVEYDNNHFKIDKEMKPHHTIIVAFILLFGCMTTEKATDYLEKHGRLPAICAEKYPPDTTFIAGTPIVQRDTTISHDSVPCPPTPEGKIVYVPVPAKTVITNTIHKTDTFKILDRKALDSALIRIKIKDMEIQKLTVDSKVAQNELKEARKALTLLGIGFMGAAAVIILSWYLKARKTLPI